MRKTVLSLVLILVWLVSLGAKRAEAVSPTISPIITETEASATATMEPIKTEEKEDITQPGSPNVTYRLEAVLERQSVGSWNGFNSFRKIVRAAVERGVPANTIVLVLLLPMVATLVGVLHYVFGLTGYGIFTPTMVAVTFVATGIFGGLALFALILVISVLSGLVLKKLKLHFWPARSINLLFISMGTFLLMLLSSFVPYIDLRGITIFPVLFMIMLAEDFVRTQLVKSKSEAKKLTLGTLILAISGALLMQLRVVQEAVLLYPEFVILLVVLINAWVGNYSGMRFSEINRFKRAIREPAVKKARKAA